MYIKVVFLITSLFIVNFSYSQKYHYSIKNNKESYLVIDNIYGDVFFQKSENKVLQIDIFTEVVSNKKWDKQKLKKKIDDILSKINIDTSASVKDTFIFKTIYKKRIKVKNNTPEIKINYSIKLPEKTFIKIKSAYGDVYLSNIYLNRAIFDVNNMNIVLQNVHFNANKKTSVIFAENSNIEINDCNGLFIKCKNSTINTNNVKAISIKSEQSKIKVSNSFFVNIKSVKDSVFLNNANTVKGNVENSYLKIDETVELNEITGFNSHIKINNFKNFANNDVRLTFGKVTFNTKTSVKLTANLYKSRLKLPKETNANRYIDGDNVKIIGAIGPNLSTNVLLKIKLRNVVARCNFYQN